ncbi:MAG TPA: alpha/beta hydrolase, partial [Pyrinomonadaceae bacterium]|nr:alpha/beta hydrolase [Pyrinomonadaceae bacterium]
GPVEVEILHPRTAQSVRVKLSRNLAGEAVRYMLYHPGPASQLPLFLHLAARGDFAPLAENALFYRQQIVDSGSNGLYLSITCSEDLPFIRRGEGEGPRVEETFLGSYRLVQQRAACALWPRGTIPADYREPTRSDLPVLLLSGEWDPTTPPAHGEQVVRHLPNGLHVRVPSGAHGFGGLTGVDCINRLKAEFVERGTVKDLDTTCVAGIKRSGFATAAPELKTIPLADAELSKLAGRYVADTGEFEVEVGRVEGGRLRVAMVGGGPNFITAPVSPVKFRAAGAPGFYFIFDVKAGRVEHIYAEQGGQRILTLIPKKP